MEGIRILNPFHALHRSRIGGGQADGYGKGAKAPHIFKEDDVVHFVNDPGEAQCAPDNDPLLLKEVEIIVAFDYA
jgi:hypothetical protein